ncbi:hypothetical protein BC829DRAFT_40001 [Chytridium lagenaria]|nr:hypothetical protein BC829DRAFT_40001 [Chytridium lagenaria]
MAVTEKHQTSLRFFIALFGCIIIVALLPPLRRPSPPSPSTPSQPPELSDSTPEPELIPQEPSVNFRNDFNRVTSIPASRFQPIPKRIWTFWDGNEDDIPWMITAMMKGWSFHNPSYNITVICSSKVWDYLSTPLPHNFWDGAITRQQKANWVRLAILSEHGGFWIDASTIITGSLDYILDRQRHQQTEAFAFYLDYFTLNKAIPVLRDLLSRHHPTWTMDISLVQ